MYVSLKFAKENICLSWYCWIQTIFMVIVKHLFESKTFFLSSKKTFFYLTVQWIYFFLTVSINIHLKKFLSFPNENCLITWSFFSRKEPIACIIKYNFQSAFKHLFYSFLIINLGIVKIQWSFRDYNWQSYMKNLIFHNAI